MKAVESELERLKRRQALKSQKLDAILEGLSKDVVEIIGELDSGEHRTKSESKRQPQQPLSLNGIIRQTCEQVVNKKNIRAIQNIHKDHFTFVSKLGKTIERELGDNSNISLFKEDLGKRDLLEFLDYSFTSEPHARIQEGDSSSLASQLIQIQEAIERKNYQDAHQLSLSLSSEGRLVNQNLSFELLKLAYLDLVHQGRCVDGIEYLQRTSSSKKAEFSIHFGELVGLAIRKDLDNLPKRLKDYRLDVVLEKCKQMISKEIRKSLGLPEVPPLQEVICAGLIALPELTQHSLDLLSVKKDKEMPVQVHLPKHMVHHSVVYCPITRECCHEESNKALFQNCGHVVGEHSVRKMLESNKKYRENDSFKCPTCPNQQKLSTMKEVHY
jgi:hypothetical protein